MNNIYTNYVVKRQAHCEMYHWGLKKGEESKKHKYVARVKQKNGKYRYFYTDKEYQAYLKNKSSNKLGDLKDKLSDSIDDLLGKDDKKAYLKAKSEYEQTAKDYDYAKSRLQVLKDKAQLDGKVSKKEKKQIEKQQKTVKSYAMKYKNAENACKSALQKYNKTPIGVLDNTSNKLNKTVKSGKKALSKLLFGDDSSTTSKKKHKYIAKVTLSNGKYRYFYTSDEYNSYLKRLQYQENSPDFMKDVSKIKPNEIYTAEEDMDKINERYSPYNEKTSTNCANCSVAYELRRRGYDVEALDNGGEDSYNGYIYRAYDYFKDPDVRLVNDDGSTINGSEEYLKNPNGFINKLKHLDENKWLSKSHSYTGETLTKAIKESSGDDSRGFIDVAWSGTNTGHSLVYEVSNKGDVIIRDAQTNVSYSVNDLAQNIKSARITRTDNLELKKNIKTAVTENKDAERKYKVKYDNGYYLD